MTEPRSDAQHPQWSDTWFRSLVEQSLAGIYVVQDGRFVYVNPKLAELFGYTVEEVLRLDSVDALVAPADRALVRDNIRKRVTGEVEGLRYSFRGQRKDGSPIEVEVHGNRTEVGGRPAVVGLLLDVTERRRTERERERLYHEAQQAVRAREEVLAVVSHDLRNPLNAMRLGIEVIQNLYAHDENARGLLQRVLRQTERMDALIQDLLDVSLLEAGRLELEIRPSDPRDLLSAAAETLQPLAAEKGIALECDAEAATVAVDRDRIVQVLSNLGGNAVKFTPRGGRIALRAETLDGVVRFSVADTGPGIPEADLAHVFDRFWTTREGNPHGSGLGLAIARGIVDAHGGRIWVEGREGEGSTFCFTLPLSSPEHAAA